MDNCCAVSKLFTDYSPYSMHVERESYNVCYLSWDDKAREDVAPEVIEFAVREGYIFSACCYRNSVGSMSCYGVSAEKAASGLVDALDLTGFLDTNKRDRNPCNLIK